MSLSAYGALAEGRGEHKLPGQEGVSDLGAGLRLDYPVTEDLSLSAGGAYRQTNADALQITRSYQAGTTRQMQASAAATYDLWVLGFEYGGGTADAVAAMPRLNLNGYQASLGYDFSSCIQVSTGWQRLMYQRSSGTFYNGFSRINLDAVFLHLNLKTSG